METMSANTRPRRSRRASLSCMPSDMDDPEAVRKALSMAKTKEELYEEYKAEKAARLKAHEEAEQLFKQKQTVELIETSGLAEEEEKFTTKVSLETFDRPKVSRRQRRASMGVSLQILPPPEEISLELEEVERVVMPSSPVAATATFDGGIFTGGAWDGSATTDPNIMFSAEALAGWKTVTFQDGPLGMQLEPTVGDKACRVTGFLDTLGCPSQARASGKIQFDDVIVKVNSKVPKSYEETLEMIAEGGERLITFRPGFSYELVDLSKSLDSPGRNKAKKKVGRVGRRASMGCVPSSNRSPGSPTDVFSNLEQTKSYKSQKSDDLDYGYDQDMGYDDMGYGDPPAPPKEEKKKSKKGRRASMGAIPGNLSKEEIYKSKKMDSADMGYGEPEKASPKEKKKTKRGRRASCIAAMPDMPGLVSATEAKSSFSDEQNMGYEPAAPAKEEVPKKKVSSKRGRRASMSAIPANMPGLVCAADATKAMASVTKEEKIKPKKKDTSSSLGYDEPSSDMGYEQAEQESKVEKKKTVSKRGRRASMSAIPAHDVDPDAKASKSKLAVIEAMEQAENAKKDKKKKKEKTEEAPASPKDEKKKKKKEVEEELSKKKKEKSKSDDKEKDKKKKKEPKEKN